MIKIRRMTGKYAKPKQKCRHCGKIHIEERMIHCGCGHWICDWTKLINCCGVEWQMPIIENMMPTDENGVHLRDDYDNLVSVHIYDTSKCPECRYTDGGRTHKITPLNSVR